VLTVQFEWLAAAMSSASPSPQSERPSSAFAVKTLPTAVEESKTPLQVPRAASGSTPAPSPTSPRLTAQAATDLDELSDPTTVGGRPHCVARGSSPGCSRAFWQREDQKAMRSPMPHVGGISSAQKPAVRPSVVRRSLGGELEAISAQTGVTGAATALLIEASTEGALMPSAAIHSAATSVPPGSSAASLCEVMSVADDRTRQRRGARGTSSRVRGALLCALFATMLSAIYLADRRLFPSMDLAAAPVVTLVPLSVSASTHAASAYSRPLAAVPSSTTVPAAPSASLFCAVLC